MDPLGFIKQKLQQGLSSVENWGEQAGNDVSHAVGQLFGGNASPQQPAISQRPLTNNSPLPSQLQVQNSMPQPNPNPQIAQPKPVPIVQPQNPDISAPKMVTATAPATPIRQVAPPQVQPIKIAQPKAPGFWQQVANRIPQDFANNPTVKAAEETGNTIGNFAKGAGEFAVNLPRTAIVDPITNLVKGKNEVPIANNPFYQSAAPLSNTMSTAIVAPSVERAANQSASDITKTYNSVYGGTPAGRAFSDMAGNASKEDMLNWLLGTAGMDIKTSVPTMVKNVGLQAVNATAPLAFGEVPEGLLNAAADSRAGAFMRGVTNGSLDTGDKNLITNYLMHGDAASSTVPPEPSPLGTAPHTTPTLPNSLSAEGAGTEPIPQDSAAGQERPLLKTQSNTPTPPVSSEQPGSSISSLDNTTNPAKVNDDEFLPRNLEAEQGVLEEMHNSGSYDQAVMRYAETAGVDQMTAMQAVNRTLKEAGIIPVGDTAESGAAVGPIDIPDGTPPRTAKAAQDLADTYMHRADNAADTNDLLRKATGKSEEFKVRGQALEDAMSKELTPAERQAVRDNLENAAKPGEVTPKVDAVTRLMRQLNEQGYNVLDTTRKDGLSRVKNYATRLARSGLSRGGTPIKVAMNKLSDLFNTESRFSQSREVGKFVATDGDTRYGTQTSLGLKRDENGNLVKDGKVFHPQSVSTRELHGSGVIKYESDYGKIANEYHSHVGRVKARYDALQQLLRNPDKFQISDTQEPGMTEIRNVPELDGKFAPSKVANQISETFKAPDTRPIYEQIWQRTNSMFTQLSVMNPLFHGRNLDQLAGMAAGKESLIGPAELKASYARLLTNGPEYRQALLTRMLRAGGGLESYGSRDVSLLTKAIDSVGLPRFNKLNATAMERLDGGIRLSLFDQLTHHGVTDEDAAQTIDDFMGDRKASGRIGQNVGMFWRYARTQLKVAGNVTMHPIANRGALLAFAEQAAVFYGMTKAFQAWTGNKHAGIGHPGMFGLLNDADNLAHGRLGAVASSKLNPLTVTGIDQATNTNLYSGTHINSGIGPHIKDAVSTLISPSQYSTKIADGKASIGQEAAQFLTGASLPHTKGAPAAPNLTSGPGSLLNTKGAQPAQGSDKTGLDQATLYYNAKSSALKAVQNNPEATDAINAYLDKDINSQGQKVSHSPQETIGLTNLLAGNSAALSAMQKFQQSQPNHDPMWDLKPGDLHEFLNYQGTRDTDPTKQVKQDVDTAFNNGQGLKAFIKQRDAYYQSNPFNSTAVSAPGAPQYPAFQGQQGTDYNFYEQNKASWSAAQRSSFLNSHPDVVDATNQVSQYYNNMGVAQGGNAEKTDQQFTPQQQTALNYYDSLPKSSGARSAWIKANPGIWSQITGVLAQNTLLGASKAGATNMYVGEQPSSQYLGDIYNLGHYDIAKGTDANGNPSFSMNPQAAYAQSKSGSQRKPLVTLPARPKKHTVHIKPIKHKAVRVIKLKKSAKFTPTKVKPLKTVHIGHPGPLKIK